MEVGRRYGSVPQGETFRGHSLGERGKDRLVLIRAGDGETARAVTGIQPSMLVRAGTINDVGPIRLVNEAAFGRPDEADLIACLRAEGVVLTSLVAEQENRIVGHILFSRMFIDTSSESVPAVALAPLVVAPVMQRQGIGGVLIMRGLEILRGNGERIVIVLGHPNYYSRFGFSAKKAQPIASPFPPEAFMALELSPGALDGIRGSVRYPDAFGLPGR